jgi:hypothetical protein
LISSRIDATCALLPPKQLLSPGAEFSHRQTSVESITNHQLYAFILFTVYITFEKRYVDRTTDRTTDRVADRVVDCVDNCIPTPSICLLSASYTANGGTPTDKKPLSLAEDTITIELVRTIHYTPRRSIPTVQIESISNLLLLLLY